MRLITGAGPLAAPPAASVGRLAAGLHREPAVLPSTSEASQEPVSRTSDERVPVSPAPASLGPDPTHRPAAMADDDHTGENQVKKEGGGEPISIKVKDQQGGEVRWLTSSGLAWQGRAGAAA